MIDWALERINEISNYGTILEVTVDSSIKDIELTFPKKVHNLGPFLGIVVYIPTEEPNIKRYLYIQKT
jgi:hypothetical protein